MILRVVFICAVIAATALYSDSSAATSAGPCVSTESHYDVPLPGHPFSVQEMPSGDVAFASVNSGSPRQDTGIGILRCVAGRFTFSRLIHLEPQPTGLALTHDGKLLVVADDGFIVFIDTAKALSGKDAIAGYMQGAEGSVEDNDAGAVYAAVSPDDRFAFVSEENAGTITVIDLAKANRLRYSRAAVVGDIEVANAPIALSFSNDGKSLFATSEAALRRYGWPPACRPEGSPPDAKLERPAGVIFAIDVAKAESAPKTAVIAKIPGDCSPVRMSLSPDGATAWVSNRASNSVSSISTEKLLAGDTAALGAPIAVGSNPVAIAATRDGKYVLAGNTNRFGDGGTGPGTVSVVDAASKQVVGLLRVGEFPREFSRGTGTTLFLANNRSDTITVFDEARITAR
jgi:DNA-binding beta-propeller fold protein YncE